MSRRRSRLPVRSFSQTRDVLAALEDDTPQVLVSDIRMPGGSGLELLTTVKKQLPGLPVIIMTAYSDLDSAVSAFQGGAFEYLPKPFDLPRAVELIRRAVDESQREEVAEERMQAAPEMLGQAPAMQDVFRAIGRLSQSNVTVLITGESGSGKELVARALHKHSPRASGPFIAINTAAIPKDLLESELSGHERGAFTGAQTMRRGRFEQAEGGTLFLDEIGDMPMQAQTRLLRALQSGSIRRVGGREEIKVDARIVAATNKDLEPLIAAGQFREDLYYRLNVVPITLPALRERTDDIPALARHFLKAAAAEGLPRRQLSSDAADLLSRQSWRGNVRELRNFVYRMALLAREDTIDAVNLGPLLDQVRPAPAEPGEGTAIDTAVSRWLAEVRPVSGTVYDAALAAFERPLFAEILRETGGNQVRAAQQLGINRNTLRKRLGELALDPEEFARRG